MPAKATIYNMKSEAVFDFGTGPRNFGFYNPHGNNILSYYITCQLLEILQVERLVAVVLHIIQM